MAKCLTSPSELAIKDQHTGIEAYVDLDFAFGHFRYGTCSRVAAALWLHASTGLY